MRNGGQAWDSEMGRDVLHFINDFRWIPAIFNLVLATMWFLVDGIPEYPLRGSGIFISRPLKILDSAGFAGDCGATVELVMGLVWVFFVFMFVVVWRIF